MDTLVLESVAARLHRDVHAARAHTDALFGLVGQDTLYERPIGDRHRLIFYVGHLDAFDWNQLARGVLDLKPFHPSFDALFEAGIDPPPGQAPADRASDWPALHEVLDYVARTRRQLDAVWDELPADRVLTALEHRWMHAETLCYLLHELPPAAKRAPVRGGVVLQHATLADLTDHWVHVAGGTVLLGQAAGAFGWDNEFPRHLEHVDAFDLARHKVTNHAYLQFVEAGGPVPHFWTRRADDWWLRRMFDVIPLPPAAPVYLTHDQAIAYARWAGARLPTEAEWQRAAYGAGERRYPWGDAPCDAARANVGFVAWDTLDVTANPAGATPEGVQQMLGNGWEWTATPFGGFEGFRPQPHYPGYSANFFDGEHFVLKGGSARTAVALARPSFRNWFRREYPYAYATVRLAR